MWYYQSFYFSYILNLNKWILCYIFAQDLIMIVVYIYLLYNLLLF